MILANTGDISVKLRFYRKTISIHSLTKELEKNYIMFFWQLDFMFFPEVGCSLRWLERCHGEPVAPETEMSDQRRNGEKKERFELQEENAM